MPALFKNYQYQAPCFTVSVPSLVACIGGWQSWLHRREGGPMQPRDIDTDELFALQLLEGFFDHAALGGENVLPLPVLDAAQGHERFRDV